MIKKITDVEATLSIARKNPHYFNDTGINLMKKDFAVDDLYGNFDGEALIGFISIKKVNTKLVEISWMAVLPKHQGKGVGSDLLKYVFKEFERYGQIQVKTLAHTDPDTGFERTRHFYQKHGFESIEVIDPYPEWGEGNPCEILVKKLGG